MLGAMFQEDEDAMTGFELTTSLLIKFKFLESKFDFSILQRYVYLSLCVMEPGGAESSSADGPSKEMMASIRAKTADLYCQIYAYHVKMAVHYSHSTVLRYLKDFGSYLTQSSWNELVQNLKDLSQQIQSQLEVLSSVQTASIYQGVAQICEDFREMRAAQKASRRQRVLARLKHAEEAIFDHSSNYKQPRCLRDTQVQPLQQIQDWCEDDGSEMILWYMEWQARESLPSPAPSPPRLGKGNGRAGLLVGKETQLVGSFFFRQGNRDADNTGLLVPTLAWSLVHALPLLEPHILDAIERNPGIHSMVQSVQWKHLVSEPLSMLDFQALNVRYVVVIDSLDECSDHEQIPSILRLFEQLSSLSSPKLKFFISSRPERHIRNAFGSLSPHCYRAQALSKIQPGMSDITTFLTSEFTAIATRLGLPAGWPGSDSIEKINLKADGLYVYASTACRFVDDIDY
jgi:hypothetical protein